MRQPQVARAALFALALVLVLPVLVGAWSSALTTAFLVEFLSPDGVRPLSRLTAPPHRSALAVPGVAADRYAGGVTTLVLVHGLAPEGKDDVRLDRAADLLARTGFAVVVPTIPGLVVGRLRPPDVEAVVATIAACPPPAVVVGVSVGAGPALLAAADPRVRDRLSTVVSLGGYASARELVRFYLAGTYRYGALHGRVPHDPAMIRAFVRANADLLPAGDLAALPIGDPAAIDQLLAHLPAEVSALLERLSPERVASQIRARLILVHGRADPAVPYTESLRLAAARPARTHVVLLGLVEHVEGHLARRWSDLRDAASLWAVVYQLVTAA